LTGKEDFAINATMPEKYQIQVTPGHTIIDGRINLSEGDKTLEQLRKDFYQKWDNNLVTAFPLLQEGESQEQVLEKSEVYQRPHAEIYTVSVHPTHPDVSQRLRHVAFMHEAKLAGFQIETVVAIDTSRPWYRRLLRQEPRRTEVTFVLIAPPRQAPKQ
jgi:hypothetical protein